MAILRNSLLLALLGASILFGSACRPAARVAGSCQAPNELTCIAADRALACESGLWTEVRCGGSKGCARRGGNDDCDDTLAAEGDACPREPPSDYACTADRREALICNGGHYGVWRKCRGEHGCDMKGDGHLTCDTTLGEIGDPCEKQGAYACSTDRRTMLACDGKALVAAASCRGPNACTFDGDANKVDCDDRMAADGDSCERANRITCGIGGNSELMCDGHQYRKKRDCRHAGCRIDGNELFCD